VRWDSAGQAPANAATSAQGPQGCEIDHLISLELGGANDPECAGSTTLCQAQALITIDLIAAFKTYIGEDPSVVSSNGVARCKHQRDRVI
jgi:hypothetical protein